MTASSTAPTVATVPETPAQASRRDFIKKGAATATFFSTLGPQRRLGRRLRCPGKRRSQDRLHPPDRLRQCGDGFGAGL